ncbi:MAG: GHKL domain-containing protein [Butyrivibrio sp.]|nr:GHKL domain-containing protein [Butyrivibrio sp.]
MGEYISIISGVFLAFLMIIIIQKFMDVFLAERSNNIIKYVGWTIYFTFLASSNLTDMIKPWVLLSFNIFFIFALGIIDRHASVKSSIFFSILICSVWMLVEVASALVVEMFGISVTENRDAVSFVSQLIMILLVVLSFKSKSRKGPKYGNIPNKYFVMILAIPLICIYLMNKIYMISTRHHQYNDFAAISSVFLLLINFIIFEVYSWMSRDVELKSLNKLYGQQLELCSRQAAEQEQLYMEIKRTRHDMKNHLAGLLGMIESGENDEAVRYVKQLLADGLGKTNEEISKSGNIVVDSLVNYKYSIAQREGIAFEASIFVPATLPFRSEHVVIILGNLLENAFDACMKVQPKGRYIKLDMSFEKNMLKISIINSCIFENRRDRYGRFFSTKSDAEHHGIGLASIKQAVSGYDGDVIIDDKGNQFGVIVIMYGKEEASEG